jgi:branched-chain amino acid aminotransferase
LVGDKLICYFNGAFVPLSEAKVGVMTRVINYGTACFEGIRAYWSADQRQLHVFRMHDHFDRLRRSAQVLLIELPHSAEPIGCVRSPWISSGATGSSEMSI